MDEQIANVIHNVIAMIIIIVVILKIYPEDK